MSIRWPLLWSFLFTPKPKPVHFLADLAHEGQVIPGISGEPNASGSGENYLPGTRMARDVYIGDRAK